MSTPTRNPYTGAQLALYDESLRLVPAIVKAKLADDGPAAFELYRGLLDDGDAAGLTREETWATFGTASMAWVSQLFTGAADRLSLDVDVLLTDAIHASAFWSPRGD